MSRLRLCSLIVVLAIAGAPSCANVSHGSTQTIQLVSDPPGAKVTVDSDPVPYITPATVVLKRGEDHTLVFRKDGFEDASAELTRSMSGAVFGNLIIGGMAGVMTDYGSGAAYELGHTNLVNDTLTLQLVPKRSTASIASSPTPAAAPANASRAIAPSSPPTDLPAPQPHADSGTTRSDYWQQSPQ